MRRGELDGTPDVIAFAEALERACVDVVDEDGVMTKDLALSCGAKHVTTGEYLERVAERLKATLEAQDFGLGKEKL